MININLSDKDKKEMCQCRSKSCNHVFKFSDAKRVPREHYGVIVNEAVCPRCGSIYGLINYPVDEQHLTYKSKNFYRRENKIKEVNIDQRKYNVNDFIYDHEEDY